MGSIKGLVVFIMITAIATYAYATDYYVKTDGSNGAAGTSEGVAWQTISYALTQVAAGDTVYIKAGNYADTPTTSTAGTSGNEITLEGYGGAVNVTAASGDIFRINHEYYIIDGLTAYDTTGRGFDIEADNVTVQDCIAHNVDSNGIRVNVAGGANITLQRNHIYDCGGYSIYLDNGGANIYYNIIESYKPNTATQNITLMIDGAGTSYIYNNNLVGSYSFGMYIANASHTATIKNNIILGYGLSNENAYGIQVVSGTVTYDYNLITPNMQNYTKRVSGGTDGGNNLAASSTPEFVAYRNKGVILLCNDDYLDDFEEVAAIWNAYGFGVTGALYWIENKDEENLETRLQALVNAGNDIGNHTRSNTDATGTYNGTITYNGSDANPVYNVNRTTNVLTLSTTEGNDDISVTDIDTKTIEDFETAISGSNWSYLKQGNNRSTTFMTSLADTGGDSAFTAGTHQTTYDVEDFLDNEVGWNNTYYDSLVSGFTMKAISYPFWGSNQSVWENMQRIGMYIGRSGSNGKGYDLRSLEIYDIQNTSSTGITGDGSEAGIKAQIRHLCRGLASGYVGAITTHAVASEFTENQMNWIAEELVANSAYVDVMTSRELGDLVQNSGNWTDADSTGLRWTRTYSTESDYRLQTTSPCIDSGENVGLTLDFAGEAVDATPNIGAYEAVAVETLVEPHRTGSLTRLTGGIVRCTR